MLSTKFSNNVIFMVPDGSAIIACWSCRFLEPATVFEGYKWITLAVTVQCNYLARTHKFDGGQVHRCGKFNLFKVYCWKIFTGELA